MSSPPRQRYGETAPTWLERVPGLERTAEIFLKLFVLTAPLGFQFVNGLDLLAAFSEEASAAVDAMFAELLSELAAIALLVWTVAVAVWVGSHIFRPHAPIRFEHMPFVLTASSFVLYLIALA